MVPSAERRVGRRRPKCGLVARGALQFDRVLEDDDAIVWKLDGDFVQNSVGEC